MSPPITLYVVRWLYPDPNYTRFSALKDMPVLPTSSSLTYAIALYLTWQVAYYVFVVVRQKEKIKAGKRVTSYTWLLNDPKAGVISKVAHTFGEKYSIITFMGMQLIYTVRIPLGSLAMLTYVDLSLHFLYLSFLTLSLSHLFSLLYSFISLLRMCIIVHQILHFHTLLPLFRSFLILYHSTLTIFSFYNSMQLQ